MTVVFRSIAGAAILTALFSLAVLMSTDALNDEAQVEADHEDGRDAARVMRFGGEDRYETAALVLQAYAEGAVRNCDEANGCAAPRHGEECGRSGVILTFGVVRGDMFADALASAAWDPTVVVHPNRVPELTLDVLRRHTSCRNQATVFGDTDAVSEAVTRQLREQVGTEVYERFAGADRYATAVDAARTIHANNFEGQPLHHLFVASGENWPDGLTLGSVLRTDRSPVVLTRRDALPAVTAEFIREARPQNVILVGGPAAISEQVAAEIDAIAGSTDVEYHGQQRFAGRDRQGTALAIADYFVATGLGSNYEPKSVTIVRPDSFADSIVAVTAALMFDEQGGGEGPILIAESRTHLGDSNEAWIRTYAESIDTIRILGEEDVVAASVADQAAAAAADRPR